MQREISKPGRNKTHFETNLVQKLNDKIFLDEGFEVYIFSRKKRQHFHSIELRCGNLARPPQRKGTGKRKSRAPITKELCCPFKIVVYYNLHHG